MSRRNRVCLSLQCGKCTRVLTETTCLFTSCGHMFCMEGGCTKLRSGSKAKDGSRCEQCERPCDASTLDMAVRKDENVERAVYMDVLEELENVKRVTEFRLRQHEIQVVASQQIWQENKDLKIEVHKALAEAEQYRNENAKLQAENGKLRTSLRKHSRRNNESRHTSMATAVGTDAATGNNEFLSRVTSEKPLLQPAPARRRDPRKQLPSRPSVPMPAPAPAPAPVPAPACSRALPKYSNVTPSAAPRVRERGAADTDRYAGSTKRRSSPSRASGLGLGRERAPRTRHRGTGTGTVDIGRYRPAAKRRSSPSRASGGVRGTVAATTSRATTYATARGSIPGRRTGGASGMEQSYRSRDVALHTKGVTKPLHRSAVRGVSAAGNRTSTYKSPGTTITRALGGSGLLDRTRGRPSASIGANLKRYGSSRVQRPGGAAASTSVAASRRTAGTGTTFRTAQWKPALRPRGGLMASRASRPPILPRR